MLSSIGAAVSLVRAEVARNGTSEGAAVELARDRGARAVEAYPMTTTSAIAEEMHVGTVRTFAHAGLVEVGHPSPRRFVMRLEFRA